MRPDGTTQPSGGVLTAFEPPVGPGLRTDTYGYAGYATSPNFDSLLAKVVVSTPRPDLAAAARRASAALGEFRIEGPATNIGFLRAVLQHPDFLTSTATTRFVDEHLGDLLATRQAPERSFPDVPDVPDAPGRAGVRLDSTDPLAVLELGKSAPAPVASSAGAADADLPTGTVAIRAPMQGTIVSLQIEPGDEVVAGRQVLVLEAMKMEHEIARRRAGGSRSCPSGPATPSTRGTCSCCSRRRDVADDSSGGDDEIDLDHVRPDLAEILERHRITLDEARPDAVEKRRRTGQRTARENIDDLCDPGSFVEHGQLVLTPGTGLPREEVIRKFPTDGMVTGVGAINGSSCSRRTTPGAW